MKVLLICCLAFASALALPQNEKWKSTEEELSNDIGDYQMYQKPKPLSMLSPQTLYKQAFSLETSDMGTINGVLRILIKPILSSVEFRVLTDFVAETLKIFREDPQIKAMIRQGVDSIQSLYEGSNEKLGKQLFTWMVSQYSDEETARSISSLVSDVSPSLQSWIVEPMKVYYRSYITPTFASIANAVNSLFGDDLASNEIARSGGRWSSVVEVYLDRLVDMTSEARDIMLQTADFLKQQDEAEY